MREDEEEYGVIACFVVAVSVSVVVSLPVVGIYY